MVEGQKIQFEAEEIKNGDIMQLKGIPVKTEIHCIESRPGDGGVFVKSAGSAGTITRVVGQKIFISMPSKKEKEFNPNCRAIVGRIAGAEPYPNRRL